MDSGTSAAVEPARAAYVHVPFCRHHCGYCNFTVVAGHDDLAESLLLAIERELANLEGEYPLDTLYIGGGTPTHLPVQWLARLVEMLERRLPKSENCEFTVEANPVDVNAALLSALSQMGVTRVSLGVQSFQTRKLQLLERDHDASQAREAARCVQRAGLKLSLDLIFAVNGESLEEWVADLNSAIHCQPEHLSTYGLTVEKGTRLHAQVREGERTEVNDELQRSMYLRAIDDLSEAGWEHYEVSSFARAGARCRHNQKYWDGSSYLAFGPGASRFVDGRRETNHRSTFTYLDRVHSGESPVMESEQLGPEDAARERLVFALRRIDGVHMDQFQRETGFSVHQLLGSLEEHYKREGLLIIKGSQLRLTREGILLSDAIWPELLRC